VSLVLKTILLLPLLGAAYFSFLSMTAQQPDIALIKGKLRPCPGNPNCVCSEVSDNFFIAPLLQNGGDEAMLGKVASAIIEMGGEIREQRQGFLWATFRSRLFRFVDDLEVRLDSDSGALHVRSESRSGRSDLGVNRSRVETLRQRLQG